MKKKFITSLILLIQNLIILNAQSIDSLINRPFKDLETTFWNSRNDTIKSRIYADAYLAKAKLQKDSINIADGYRIQSYFRDFEISIEYCDSILFITEHIEDKKYPALAYMLKGYYNYYRSFYKEAVDHYLHAYKLAKARGNLSQINEIEQFLGSSMLLIGNHSEAIKIFHKQYKKITSQPNYEEEYINDYFIVLDNLGKTYLLEKKPDSALLYLSKGINLSLKLNKKKIYEKMVFTSGVAFYQKGNYKSSLDSLNKVELSLEERPLAVCYYYKGKMTQDENEKLNYFLKVDSIYEASKVPINQLHDTYKTLIEIYRDNNNLTAQYKYLNKLIEVDSIKNATTRYIDKQYVHNFKIAELHDQKEELERRITLQSKDNTLKIGILIVLFGISLGITFFFLRRQIVYKKRFNDLLKRIDDKELIIKNENSQAKNSNVQLNKISNEIVESVLQKLEVLELNNEFTDNSITLTSLSKKLNTNTSYLSKIINSYKGLSFSKYLTELRIKHATQRLTEDGQLRNYTIDAISKEMGFNSSESFSKAFYKEHGIYPSYFIKKLNKQS